MQMTLKRFFPVGFRSYLHSGQKSVQSQKNNVRTKVDDVCSNVISLTLSRPLPTGLLQIKITLEKILMTMNRFTPLLVEKILVRKIYVKNTNIFRKLNRFLATFPLHWHIHQGMFQFVFGLHLHIQYTGSHLTT